MPLPNMVLLCAVRSSCTFGLVHTYLCVWVNTFLSIRIAVQTNVVIRETSITLPPFRVIGAPFSPPRNSFAIRYSGENFYA